MEPDLKPLLDYTLACTPAEFWCRFLSNRCDFFGAFHRAAGDSAVSLSRWQRHYKIGWVRDLQFVTPLKMRMGPAQTLCIQSQRFKVYRSDRLVFETSQVMTDIPYSDHFRVETRWDVEPADQGGCHVQVQVRVPFTKTTLWRKFIEKGVADNCREAFAMWKQMAERHLASASAPGSQANLQELIQAGANRTPQGSSPLGKPPTGLSRRRQGPRPGDQARRGHRRSVSGEALSAALEAQGIGPGAPSAAAEAPAAPASRSRSSAAVVLLCVLAAAIVVLQALLLWQLHASTRQQQRQQPLYLRREGEGPGADAAVATELAGVLQDLQALQQQARAWRAQLDGVLRSAEGLAERAGRALLALTSDP